MKFSLKSQVEKTLQDHPQSRNNDVTLMILVWQTFYSKYIKKGSTGQSGIWLSDLYSLPREDNIKRIRAYFQNDKHLYLPTELEVVQKRKINEEVWRDYMSALTSFKRI